MMGPRVRGAPDANERSEGRRDASYMWALVIVSVIELVSSSIEVFGAIEVTALETDV